MFRMSPGHADGRLVGNRVDTVARTLAAFRHLAEAGNATHRPSGHAAGEQCTRPAAYSYKPHSYRYPTGWPSVRRERTSFCVMI